MKTLLILLLTGCAAIAQDTFPITVTAKQQAAVMIKAAELGMTTRQYVAMRLDEILNFTVQQVEEPELKALTEQFRSANAAKRAAAVNALK